MKPCVLPVLILSLGHLAWASDNSVEVTLEDSPVHKEPLLTDADRAHFEDYLKDLRLKIHAANVRGKAEAEKDIKAGRFRLRRCGKPAAKREVDSVTGYRIERIGPCGQRSVEFHAEVNAYNHTMREWNAKQIRRRSNQALQPTADRREDLHMIVSTLKFAAQPGSVSGG